MKIFQPEAIVAAKNMDSYLTDTMSLHSVPQNHSQSSKK